LRSGLFDQKTIYHHLGKMAVPPFFLNGDLPQNEYLEFIEALSVLLKLNAKKMTRLAFINADYQRIVRGLF